MGLLSLAKHAESVVCPTATAWFGSITLRRVSASVRAVAELKLLTLDFFSLQRSQALQTRLRIPLSECEFSEDGVDWRAVIVDVYI